MRLVLYYNDGTVKPAFAGHLLRLVGTYYPGAGLTPSPPEGACFEVTDEPQERPALPATSTVAPSEVRSGRGPDDGSEGVEAIYGASANGA